MITVKAFKFHAYGQKVLDEQREIPGHSLQETKRENGSCLSGK